jgi:hypothetical protein
MNPGPWWWVQLAKYRTEVKGDGVGIQGCVTVHCRAILFRDNDIFLNAHINNFTFKTLCNVFKISYYYRLRKETTELKKRNWCTQWRIPTGKKTWNFYISLLFCFINLQAVHPPCYKELLSAVLSSNILLMNMKKRSFHTNETLRQD